MNVLSLFDGLSCGQVALNRLGIKDYTYYASEIDKYAIQVTQHNYPNTIQLGNVEDWRKWDIDWSKIDLVTSGFLCQSWSMSGKQMGDRDPRGRLFWTMLDIIKTVKLHNPKATYLIENVKMKKEFEGYITYHTEQALGKTEKYLINSALVSAQNRKRYYWTNIPNVSQPKDKGILLCDIIESGMVDRDKSFVIAANYFKGGNLKQYFEKHRRQLVFIGSIVGRRINPETGKRDDYNNSIPIKQRLEVNQSGKSGCLTTVQKDNVVVYKDLSYRKLTPLECERLQTIPDNYTLVKDKSGKQLVSNSQRYKMLGNAWTVAIIVHILKNFLTNPN